MIGFCIALNSCSDSIDMDPTIFLVSMASALALNTALSWATCETIPWKIEHYWRIFFFQKPIIDFTIYSQFKEEMS